MIKESVKEEMERLVEHLKSSNPGSEEYRETLAHLEILNGINATLYELPTSYKLLYNGPLVTGFFGLLGILTLVSYERIGIVTSSAMRFIRFK